MIAKFSSGGLGLLLRSEEEMANSEIKMQVDVGSLIHKALCEFAQHVFDEHGVQLHSVKVEWWDISTGREQKAIVASVLMETKTMAGSKQD